MVFKGLPPVIFAEVFLVIQQLNARRETTHILLRLVPKRSTMIREFAKIVAQNCGTVCMPSHMKEIDINEFKHVTKTWKPDLCSC